LMAAESWALIDSRSPSMEYSYNALLGVMVTSV
jgi:hypothetical protein